MGIRVYCPNGHRLNVKASQAGRRGKCPHCGAGFQIPASDKPPAQRGPTVQTVPTGPTSSGSHDSAPEAVAGMSGSVVEPAAPGGHDAAHPSSGVRDPLAEPPEAVWYVRTPAGEQFGPAGAKTMREWLEAGRVVDEALVWREGWAEWAVAGDVFGRRAAVGRPADVRDRSSSAWEAPMAEGAAERMAGGGGARPSSVARGVIPAIKVDERPAWPGGGAHRRAERRLSYVVIGLSVVVVLLGVALIWVLNR